MTSLKKHGGKISYKKGGNGGASGYGVHVWGSGNQQHGGTEDNTIVALHDPATFVRGGSTQKLKGGNLATMGVPALLLAANHLYKPKSWRGKNKVGGSINGIKKGAGILTELAVPAVLITANHLYRRSKKNTTRNNRTRKVSFKRRSK
jgi:hypothetical protein